MLEKYVHNGVVMLFHYTNYLGGETEVLDPEIALQNMQIYSKREYATSNVPRLFFYLDPSEKEHFVSAKNLYVAKVSPDVIYDFTLDPDLIVRKWKGGNAPGNYNMLFNSVKEAGYKGAAYSLSRDVVVYFEPLEVRRIDSSQFLKPQTKPGA